MPISAEALLSDLVVDTRVEDLPEDAMAAAVRQLFDCVGVTLAASVEPAGKVIAQVSESLGGNPQARLLGSGLKTSVAEAAWSNGSLAHLLDFDDTGFSHPTACLLPAALAVGELTDASGRDVVAALVLGYEVFERLAACARSYEPVLRSRGYHPTTIWGAPAASAVAGKLLGLGREQMRVAFGLAASNASGLTQQFGTWAKGVNAGNAARSGVMGALLAHRGYWADDLGITGPYGLFSAVVGEGNYDLSGIHNKLGTRWSISEPGLSIKPYPACTSTLRAVDAMLKVYAAKGYRPTAVDRIVVHVHPDLLHTLRFHAPVQGFRGKFSLDYTVAAAALDGAVTIDSFSDAWAARSEFRAMLGKIVLEQHPEWPLSRRHDNPVVVTLEDATVLEAAVPAHHGTQVWPLSWEQVVEKYMSCAAAVLPVEQARQSVGAVAGIEGAERIADVIDLLVNPNIR